MIHQLIKSCLLLFLLVPFGIQAQDYIVQTQHFGTEEGLSHRDVQSIHQDSSGIIWLGTRYGLNRFDGYRFQWYTKETHDFQSNIINHVREDQDGNLWLFDTDGYHLKEVHSIDIFDPITEKSQSFNTYFGETVPIKEKEILSFTQNKQGHFAFLTINEQLVIYDGSFKQFPTRLDDLYMIYDLHWKADGQLWLACNYKEGETWGVQLRALDPSGQISRQLMHPGYNYIKLMDVDPDGTCRYFISKQTGISVSSIPMIARATSQTGEEYSENEFYPPILRKNIVSVGMIFEEKEDYYYIFNDQKISLYNAALPDKYQPIDELNIPFATDLLFGSNDQVWISSQFGLYKVELKSNQFSKLLYKAGYEPGDNFATRNLILDDSSNLWVIAEGLADIWKVNLNSGEVTTLNQSRSNQDQLKVENSSVVLHQARDHSLWVQSGAQLIKFNPTDLTYEKIRTETGGGKFSYLWSLYEDSEGKIWYTTDQGVIGFIKNGVAQLAPPLTNIQSPNYLYHFHLDQSGVLWLATEGGLFVLDQKTGKMLERYWAKGKGKYHLPFENIYHIHEDEDGSFWLGTGGTGLIHWNKGKPFQKTDSDQEYFRQYSRVHGLNNVIYAVYEDEQHFLWLPSDNGIIRFDKASKRTKTYLEKDGISHHEFNRASHHQAKDGTLFFGGLNGLTAFHPDQFTADSSQTNTPLVITNFQQFDADGKEDPGKELQLKKEKTIIFQPDDRFFRLEFALLSYQHIEKNLYAFKLEGVDKNWNYQKENFIRFSRLPYGKHTLRIKGQSEDGQWSAHELAIQLYVLKPIYLQTWFLITLLMGFLLFAFIFYKVRVTQLKHQAAMLETEVANRTATIRQQSEEIKALERLKSRFFANVSHELRTPLTLMLGPISSLLKREYWKERDRKLLTFANRNGKHLLKLVNEILDLSKLESGKLELKESPINLYDFLHPMMTQFHSFGDSEHITFEFDYQADKDLVLLLDVSKFEKIIHNYLSNALKHTPLGGTIGVYIQDKGQSLLLEVKDTGPGIHPDDLPRIFDRFYQSKQTDQLEQGGTGIGLSLCSEMAALLGGKVWVESTPGKGSSFFFSFPKKEVSAADIENSTQFEEKQLDFSLIPNPKIKKVKGANGKHIAQNKTKERKIIIVEDNADLRSYIQTLLEDDYETLTAENGLAGWELIKQGSDIDLIISDLMMPVMNGFELLDKLKSSDAYRHVPVILLTARADVKVKLKALRIGVDDYITKPFVEEELKARVKNLLLNLKARLEALSVPREEILDEKLKTIDIKVAQKDLEWLKEVEKVFASTISERQFKIDWIAGELNLSDRQFRRKLKSLTGLGPNQYLREMRLQIAKDYLIQGKFSTIKETSFAVGFSDPKYFSSLFQERFGITPSRYSE